MLARPVAETLWRAEISHWQPSAKKKPASREKWGLEGCSLNQTCTDERQTLSVKGSAGGSSFGSVSKSQADLGLRWPMRKCY
jgi:hypothetical protein